MILDWKADECRPLLHLKSLTLRPCPYLPALFIPLPANMISRNQIKHLSSLHLKKNRDKERLFFVEGAKMLHELLLSSYKVHSIYALEEWLAKNEKPAAMKNVAVTPVTEIELSKISSLSTPQQVIAFVQMPDYAIELT